MKTKFSMFMCVCLAGFLVGITTRANEGGEAPNNPPGTGQGSYRRSPSPPQSGYAAVPAPRPYVPPPETPSERAARLSTVIAVEMEYCRERMMWIFKTSNQCEPRVLEHFIRACDELKGLTEPLEKRLWLGGSVHSKILYSRVFCISDIQIDRSTAGRCPSAALSDPRFMTLARYDEDAGYGDYDDQFANEVPAGSLLHLAQGSPLTAEERLRQLRQGGQTPPAAQQPAPRAAPPAARQAPASHPAIADFDRQRRLCHIQFPYN